MKRIIISIPKEMIEKANAIVTSSIDIGATDTFVDNEGVAQVGIPDDGSVYSEAMKTQFKDYIKSYTDKEKLETVKAASITLMTSKAGKVIEAINPKDKELI